MASEEERIHSIWVEGYNLIEQHVYHKVFCNWFIDFRKAGLSDETIAAAFQIPVEDVSHDIDYLLRGKVLCDRSNKLADEWIGKNGPSPLLEGYDE